MNKDKKEQGGGLSVKEEGSVIDNVWFDSMTRHVYGLGKMFVQIPKNTNNIGSCLSLYAVDGSHNYLKTQNK